MTRRVSMKKKYVNSRYIEMFKWFHLTNNMTVNYNNYIDLVYENKHVELFIKDWFRIRLPLREAFYKFQFLCSRAFEEAIFEGIALKKDYRIKFIGNDFNLFCDLNSLMDNRTVHMTRLFNLPAFRFLKLEELECLITQKEILAS